MIDLTFIRNLTLSTPVAPGRPNYLCAASGLVRIKNHFYVVADDELGLGIFPAAGDEAGELFPLFLGELPLAHAERKKHKPDLEVITHLRPEQFSPFGAIVVVPSGSKPNRFSGALLPLGKNGEPHATRVINFGSLYKQLLLTLPDLNIEGAVIADTVLKLFQRGNSRNGKNAVIDVCLKSFLNDLQNERDPSHQHIRNISFLDLGELNGIPLSFTDAALYMEREIWFLAAAENTDSTYADGEYRGAVIGRLNPDGSLGKMVELNSPQKPEGLWFSEDRTRGEFYVVTDADRASSPSVLYRGTI